MVMCFGKLVIFLCIHLIAYVHVKAFLIDAIYGTRYASELRIHEKEQAYYYWTQTPTFFYFTFWILYFYDINCL